MKNIKELLGVVKNKAVISIHTELFCINVKFSSHLSEMKHPEEVISRLYAKCIFNFIRNHQAIFKVTVLFLSLLAKFNLLRS